MAVVSVAGLGLAGLGVSSAFAAAPDVVVQDHDGSASSLDVSWTDVDGAASYRVRYSTDDDLKKSVKTAPDVDKGNETTITGLDVGDDYYVQVTALDSKGSTLGTSKIVEASTSYPYEAPGDIYATKVTDKTMTLSWKSVGNTPGYLVEVSGGGDTQKLSTDKTSIDVSKLKDETDYSVKVRAGKGDEVLSDASPAQTFRSSRYSLAAPDHLEQGKQTSDSFALSWDGVNGLPDGDGYVVEWSKSTTFDKTDRSKTITGTKTTIDDLPEDLTYYTHMWVVDADGKRVSEVTDYITTKTLVDRGTLSGDVSGAPSGDLMAVAYDASKNAAQQVSVSDGHYSLDVRPGKYKVQIAYVGTKDDYASAFAASGGSGRTLSKGDTYTVTSGDTTHVDGVDIKHGNTVKGTVKYGSTPIRDVDVTAISGDDKTNSKAEREVLGMARTDKDGKFSIPGLPDGAYWFRFHYVGSGKGYKTYSYWKDVQDDYGLDVKLTR